jgi:hypothetical protein
VEGMQSGMIGYFVPLERFPETYNGQPLSVAALASQSCVRFRRLDDLALDLVGEAIAGTSVDDLIASHERANPPR